MNRQEYRHLHRLRVRQSEVDGKQVIRCAHYLMYFDLALESYWRALGLPDAAPLQRWNGSTVARHAEVDFRRPTHLGDILDIGLRCIRQGETSLIFSGAVFRGNEILADAEFVQTFMQEGEEKATGSFLPRSLRELIQAHDEGEPMLSLEIGAWSDWHEQARAVRQMVFIEEQAIPPEMEWDEVDEIAKHAVITNRMGQGLATGRLLQEDRNAARIGRMAVVPMLRGVGLGRQVLMALVAEAQLQGDSSVRLSAQLSALGFYRRAGFVPEGDPFDEVGIPHQSMTLALGG